MKYTEGRAFFVALVLFIAVVGPHLTFADTQYVGVAEKTCGTK